MSRLPAAQRSPVVELLNQYKSNPAHRRTHLLKKGILRSMVDELEVLSETGDYSLQNTS